jgi:hypothetical protein
MLPLIKFHLNIKPGHFLLSIFSWSVTVIACLYSYHRYRTTFIGCYRTIDYRTCILGKLSDHRISDQNYWTIGLQKTIDCQTLLQYIPNIIRTPTFPVQKLTYNLFDIFSIDENFRILCLQLICCSKKTEKHLILLYITCLSRENVFRVQIQKEIISYFNP